VELNVAVAGEVGRDATVGTVGAPAAIDGTLHNNVVDGATIKVEALNLGVGAQVDEQLADGLDGLLGPSSEGGVLVVLQLSVATNTTSEAGVWDNLLLLSAVLEVCDRGVELSSLHCLGNVVGVLEMNAEVGDLALSG
jgi:hypothetical protein